MIGTCQEADSLLWRGLPTPPPGRPAGSPRNYGQGKTGDLRSHEWRGRETGHNNEILTGRTRWRGRETGPQAYNPGGEIAVWESRDEGATWTKARQLTHDSMRDHTYVRRPLNAQPGFYGLWADGHGRQPSESRLYFYDASRDKVFQLPPVMDGDTAAPIIVE